MRIVCLAMVASLAMADRAMCQDRGESRRGEGRFQRATEENGGGGGGEGFGRRFGGGGMGGGGEGYRGGMGGGGPGQWGGGQFNGGQQVQSVQGGQGGFDRTEMLRRLDTNGNGMVDPNELEGRQRFMVERLAQQAGLDMSRPIPIDKLVAAMEERQRQRQDSQQQQQRPADNKQQSPQATKTGNNKTFERLVPGFGEPSDLPPVPSFGMLVAIVNKPSDNKSDNRAGEKSGSENRGSEKSAGDNSTGDRSTSGNAPNNQQGGPGESRRALADGMMKQYDENGNGQLEKNEWSKNPDLAKMDTNGDGIITRDELVEGLRNWRPGPGNSDSAEQGGGGRFRRGDGGPGGGGPGGGDQAAAGGQGGGWSGGRFGRRGQDGGGTALGGGTRGTAATGTTQVSRYLDPAQRLPEGLPGWFIRADGAGNNNGQVEMDEFAKEWTEAEVARFNKYDLNGDGVLTPDEVLQVEKPAGKPVPAATTPAKPPAAADAASPAKAPS